MHQGDSYSLNNYFECNNTWGPNVWDFYHITHLCRVLQILCTWSYEHETGATIEITRTCVEMVHQVMMEWRMLKALHGIGLMISQSWFSMECTAMTCVTGMHTSHLQSRYVRTVALLTLLPTSGSYTISTFIWYGQIILEQYNTMCYTCWISVALCGQTLKFIHRNNHKRMEFCAFCFCIVGFYSFYDNWKTS
jgi:hypothetical protein